MVEVTVGDNDALNTRSILLQILRIREDVVDARASVFTDELEARVEDEDIARRAHLDRGHIAPHLLDAAERDDAHARRSDRLGEIIGRAVHARWIRRRTAQYPLD